MPIPDDIREHYPDDWQKIRERIRERSTSSEAVRQLAVGEAPQEVRAALRAQPCCEWCGVPEVPGVARSGRCWMLYEVPHGPSGERRGEGVATSLEWHEVEVVLTIAHLCHDPRCDRPDHLRALCQACHLWYDRGSKRPQQIKAELRGQQPLVSAACRGDDESFEGVPQ
jgi:hypothetical protein